MAEEGGLEKQQEVVVSKVGKGVWVIPMLRVVTFMALAAATLVMALNKQTKTLVVAVIGNTPIKATLNPRFQHTPAFVFFVIANAIASFHNLLMLAVDFIGHNYDSKGLRFTLVPILDMLTVVLVSGGASAAAFMGELGRNGNSHARWNKICDKIGTFCDHGAGAIAASYIGLLLLIIITLLSILKLKSKPLAL